MVCQQRHYNDKWYESNILFSTVTLVYLPTYPAIPQHHSSTVILETRIFTCFFFFVWVCLQCKHVEKMIWVWERESEYECVCLCVCVCVCLNECVCLCMCVIDCNTMTLRESLGQLSMFFKLWRIISVVMVFIRHLALLSCVSERKESIL